eukprot:9632-Pleurochrysis_carterae.AAC.2
MARGLQMPRSQNLAQIVAMVRCVNRKCINLLSQPLIEAKYGGESEVEVNCNYAQACDQVATGLTIAVPYVANSESPSDWSFSCTRRSCGEGVLSTAKSSITGLVVLALVKVCLFR